MGKGVLLRIRAFRAARAAKKSGFQVGEFRFRIISHSAPSTVEVSLCCDKSIATVSIPESVVHEGVTYQVIGIGAWAFYDCKRLNSVTVSTSVKTIGENAFMYCGALNTIHIPNGVESIQDRAFAYCEELTTIQLPNSVKEVGVFAFANCKKLTAVNIPVSSTISIIKQGTFSRCSSLISVTLPEMLTTIEDFAFAYSAASVRIPTCVTYIGCAAFFHCTDISSITIPPSVKTVGELAFDTSSELQFIQCEALIPPTLKHYATQSSSFVSQKHIPLYVPAQSVEAYQSAIGWSEFDVQAMR